MSPTFFLEELSDKGKGSIGEVLALHPRVLCSLEVHIHVSPCTLFLSARGVCPPSPAHIAPMCMLTQQFVD